MIRGFILLVCAVCFAVSPAVAQFDVEKNERSVVRIITPTAEGVGSGTGFVVSEDGHILTNVHVIQGAVSAEAIKVYVPELEAFFTPDIVDAAPALDIALLRIEADGLVPARLSNAARDRGSEVFAIGYPGAADRGGSDIFGDAPTLTDGIISSEKVAPWAGQGPIKVRMIQHSAAVTEGNSGGPLFDACGRVIGINTQRSNREGVYWSSAIEESLAILERNDVVIGIVGTECAVGNVPLSLLPASSSVSGILAVLIALAVLAAGIVLFLSRRRPAVSGHSGSPSQGNSGQGSAGSIRRFSGAVGLAPSLNSSTFLRGLDRQGRPISLSIPGEALNGAYGVVLGREDRICDLVIEDAQLSRRHLRLFRVDGNFFIEELNSTNGTDLAGKPLQPFDPKPIENGASLNVAGLELVFSAK